METVIVITLYYKHTLINFSLLHVAYAIVPLVVSQIFLSFVDLGF